MEEWLPKLPVCPMVDAILTGGSDIFGAFSSQYFYFHFCRVS